MNITFLFVMYTTQRIVDFRGNISYREDTNQSHMYYTYVTV